MASLTQYAAKMDESRYSQPIALGGSGARSPEKAAENIGLVSRDMIGKANGIVVYDSAGNISKDVLPLILSSPSIPIIHGNIDFFTDETLKLEIANFDGFTVYDLNAGSETGINLSIVGDQVLVSVTDNLPGSRTVNFNGRQITFTVHLRYGDTPTIINDFLLNDPIDAPYNRKLIGELVPCDGFTFISSDFTDQSYNLIHETTVWQISTDINFLNLTHSSNLPAHKNEWPIVDLLRDTVLYLRLAHVSTNGAQTPWSVIYQFGTTEQPRFIVMPEITNPLAGITNAEVSQTLTATAFETVAMPDAQHLNSDWQISRNSSFTMIVNSSEASTVNKTSWVVSNLSYSTVYYARVRYRSTDIAANGVDVSDWSPTRMFTTKADNRYVEQPNHVTPVQGAVNQPKENLLVTSSVFTPRNYGDVHVSTDWQVATDAGFTNLVFESLYNTTSKTSIYINSPNNSTTYYVRMRYRGTIKTSAWSVPCGYTTIAG